MDLARTSPRHGRRRRVAIGDSPSIPLKPRRRRKDDRYALVLRRDGSLPVGKFLPHSKWAISLALLAGLLAGAGAGFAFQMRERWERSLGIGLSWLDLHQSASAVTWMYTISLWLCVGWSALLYQLRRHRIDDYRARYRVWIWLAIAWGVASFDMVAGVSKTGHAALTKLMFQPGASTWFTPHVMYAIVVLPFGVRLAREVWECRAARITLGLATLCYGAALVPGLYERGLQRGFPSSILGILAVLPLWGNWFVWTTCAVYSRQVRLEMEGESRKRSESRGQESAEPDSAPSQGEGEGQSLSAAPAGRTVPGAQRRRERLPQHPRTSWLRRLVTLQFVRRKPAADADETERDKSRRSRSRPQSESSDVASANPRTRELDEAATARDSSTRKPGRVDPSRAVRPLDTIRMSQKEREDDEDDLSHLSKTERKKLRREQRRLRDAA